MSKSGFSRGVISIYIIFSLLISGLVGYNIIYNGHKEITALAITVNDDGGADYTKIQDAINASNPGDTIYVWAGTYLENVIVNKSVTLIGNGTINTTIDGNEIGDVVYISTNWVNISGFSIKNSGNKVIPNYDSGIQIDNVENVICNNNNCSNNEVGIFINNSNNISIKYNKCNLNNEIGIALYYSNFNRIENNICNSNDYWGLLFYKSHFNEIVNNTGNLNKNYDGIRIMTSNNNIIFNNSAFFNTDTGIRIQDSKLNIIINNKLINNKEPGIYFRNSTLNILKNNSCIKNYQGIVLVYSCNFNTIERNSCKNNTEGGITIGWNSSSNIIRNNSCNNNSNGFYLEKVNNNTISKNTISNNTNTGFSIDSNCANNFLYYNHILFNNNQAIDTGNNFWNNSNQEGNYWSDYTGLDTGYMSYPWDTTGKHLLAGDGIGDTLVPHLNLDYYPFTNQLGWLKPGTPMLEDPGEVNSDGNYNLSWNTTIRTTGYILEEDNSSSFDSPTELFNGSEIVFNITGRQNDTYYYHIKAYNENYSSPWSNIENITVDWPPNIPKNLNVSVYPRGNTLNLTWKQNIIDTKEYIFEYKNETMGNWEQLDSIVHPGITYNHTGLVDGIRYDYRIQAKDYRDQLSNFSEIISGIPWDSVPPAAPTGLKVFATTNDSISLNWNPNTEDDLEGYLIFRSEIASSSSWGEPIGTILKETEEYIDTGLDELTTYYYVLTAFDEVSNNSSFSNIAFGTTILGPHGPVINNSIENFSIPEDTIDDSRINLFYWFKDINNDPLEFECEGQNNISVTIFQENGTVIIIPKKNWNGQETLTFYANDSIFEISDNITITLTPVNDPPGPAVIITPKEGIKVENGTLINFSGICDDVDLIYGDKLTFNWSSNISGRFGSGENLTDIILPPSQHQITLEVSDIVGETSITIVNITILEEEIQDYIPKFDFELILNPNTIELRPGKQLTIKAIVTNLGEVDDRIVVNIPDQNIDGVETTIIEPKIQNVIINGTAEFNIEVKVLEDAEKGEIQLNVVAASANAAGYGILFEKNATLTIKITEDEQIDKSDTLSENAWMYIFLVIIIIAILICIFILIVRRKKESKEELPTVEAEIEKSEALPSIETSQEQLAPVIEQAQLPSTTEESQEPLVTSAIKQSPTPEQITSPELQQLPPAEGEAEETVEEVAVEELDEEPLSVSEGTNQPEQSTEEQQQVIETTDGPTPTSKSTPEISTTPNQG